MLSAVGVASVGGDVRCNYVGVAPWIDGQEGRQVWQGGGGGVMRI